MQPLDLTGKRYGRLVALSPTDKRNHGRVVWTCQCDCGLLFEAVGADIKKGLITSCGNHRKDSTTAANKTIREQVEKYGTVPGMLKQKKRSSNTSGYKGVTTITLKSGVKRYKAELMIKGVKYRGPRREKASDANNDRIEIEKEHLFPFLEEIK